MINKHLFLFPELLSRLCFSRRSHDVYYVQGSPNHKPRLAQPEEIIRQLFVLSLIHQYYYPEQRIKVEYPVQMGRTKKRADIVVLGENGGVDMVVEVKQQIDHESMEQLKSYVMVTGAAYGAAVSGHEFICFKKDSGNGFVELDDLPICGGSGEESGKVHRPGKNPNRSSTAILRASLQMEHFEKIDQAHARMTIQGRSLDLSIVDLASYKKTQKSILSKGVILAADIRQSEWLSFISELLASAPDPTPRPVQTPADETACLRHILSHILQVGTLENTYERTVDELIKISAGRALDERIKASDAVPALMRMGIRVDGPKYTIANAHQAIAKVLSGTPWGHSWGKVLKRLKEAKPTKDPVRFFGVRSRGVVLPVSDY